MIETLDYLRTFATFPFALRRFMKGAPLRLPEAQRIVRERLARREANFLALVEHGVYGWPTSPYLALLKHAGCELGDVRALVQREGVEGALRQLREAGVYVTFEEFKGRKPIQRNGFSLPVRPGDFDNPWAKRHYITQTGGSTGLATSVGQSLDYYAATAPYYLVAAAAHDLLGVPTALWRGILPNSNVRPLLHYAYLGSLPERWFSPMGARDAQNWPKYTLATWYLVLWMRLGGVRVPLPELVRFDEAIKIARWAAETVKTRGRCVVTSSVSRALRVCVAAEAAGIDLSGVTFVGAGEPATPAKVRRIECAGARYVSNYVMSETGRIGSGCARPLDGSDVHLFSDGFVLFSYPCQVEGFDVIVPAFNITTLLPGAPKLMLNAQMDDYGVIEERRCGCLLEACGFTTHLREIHSYSKLTGEGVTLVGSEMLRLLEDTLPARFGGSPLDYQWLEQEDDQGFTRLYLVVSPSVKLPDEQAVVEAVLAAMSQSSVMADSARTVWQHAHTIQIKREEPVWTSRSKLSPLRVQRRPAAHGDQTGVRP